MTWQQICVQVFNNVPKRVFLNPRSYLVYVVNENYKIKYSYAYYTNNDDTERACYQAPGAAENYFTDTVFHFFLLRVNIGLVV